jgi:hypothetical protein
VRGGDLFPRRSRNPATPWGGVHNDGVNVAASKMVGILPLVLVAFLVGCSQTRVSNAAVPATEAETTAAHPKALDAVLGKWVCIADNGGGFVGAIMNLAPNGVATFTYQSETFTKKYKRELGKDWIRRRRQQLPPTFGDDHSTNHFEREGVVMVYFEEGGQYLDHGSNLLTYAPEFPMLYNPLTQNWCRPGDESRIRKLHRTGGMSEGEIP